MQEALSLSEIRTHIGLFLISNKRDLIACMLVCKDWRTDFRRLLYRDLVLGQRTFRPILGPIHWRAYGVHTQSLVLEEPSVMQKVNPAIQRRYGEMGSSINGNNQGAKSVLRSSDFNLDPIQHCPNLLHLTVKLSSTAKALCCWTREDDNDDDYGPEDNDSLGGPAPPAVRFRTTSAFRYDGQNQAWFVKSSNRILALLEYHPNLRSFHWIGDSNIHMERIGRHLLSKQVPHRLVDLHLDSLTATCSEINRVIENCPELRRLSLRSLRLVSRATWPDLEEEELVDQDMSILSNTSLSLSPTTDTQTRTISTLHLARIQSLTLDRPQFLASGILRIHGPLLQHLDLVDCAFPPSFLAEITRFRADGSPFTLPNPHVVEWTCPMLTRFKHDRGSLMPEAFTHNLLPSTRTSFRSLLLLKLTLQSTFVSDLIAHQSLCNQLTHLDLTGSEQIKSTDLQSLLCHLPALLDFTGPGGVLWGEDLYQSSKPWACIRLKRLQILICLARPDSGLWETGNNNLLFGFKLWDDLPSNDDDSTNRFLRIQKAVFQQLGQLTDLEFLDLTGGYGIEQFLHEVPRGLPWTLEAGLDQLKGLGRMKELTVSGWENKMTRKEAQWFRQWWPELKTFRTKNYRAFSRRPQSLPRQQPQIYQQLQQEVDKHVSEELVVGWLAFQMCLHHEWPARFPDPMI